MMKFLFPNTNEYSAEVASTVEQKVTVIKSEAPSATLMSEDLRQSSIHDC